jgi:uncharacterized protein
MRIAVTGSSGLIGSALVPRLRHAGHEVLRLVRARPAGRGASYWNPAAGEIDRDALRGVDAVVHLAGRPIATRWTRQVKKEILESRTVSTHLLATTIAELDGGPRALVSMSGIHYYGADRGDEILTEDSTPGVGFMPEVCQAWEAAAEPARAAGVRVAHVRGGLVLTPEGGPLERLLPLFRLGVGGRLGSGRQWWSWITLDDFLGVIEHAVTTEGVKGPLNATAPAPVTNAEFTRTLAKVLRRPAVLRVPRFGPRLVLGELADVLALGSLRVRPERTLASGYTFRHLDLEEGLTDLLHRREPD